MTANTEIFEQFEHQAIIDFLKSESKSRKDLKQIFDNGGYECIDGNLYDEIEVYNKPITAVRFFEKDIDYEDFHKKHLTNFYVKSALPRTHYFLIKSIRLASDKTQIVFPILRNSTFVFIIGSKSCYERPGYHCLKEKGDLIHHKMIVPGGQSIGGILYFSNPIQLNFRVPIRCELLGNLYRPVA